MNDDFASPEQLHELQRKIDTWLGKRLQEDLVIESSDFDPEENRWYVRITGEEKKNYMVLMTLGQRTLHFESYVMPAPEENEARFFEHLLKRNQKLHGISFSVGHESAVYLSGELKNQWISDKNLDWMLGSLYAAIELCFKAALRIGFASRFKE
ncbi:MAG: hypothetical protein VYD77_02775 [Actinomycetota bacterium]|nr:hypothetical protein [Actinomycetota bacterium]